MAAAVKQLFPKTRVTIGPSIESGFYYDFDVEKPFSSEDFSAIEAEMQRIANAREPFTREVLSRAKAVEPFKAMGKANNDEIIEGSDGNTVGVHTWLSFQR